ncbi:MAG: NAD(P)H-dependent glycerol-3-phosphate dehydrogenase [Clostridia bacterium]|nr:NAD(P)H-dependent glycerol-3-phosphate dehydrogenase [Clostridia bacterium]
MKITVIGCGRWGSLITWYLDRIGHEVTLYGRANDPSMRRFIDTRANDVVTLPESIKLTTDINDVPSGDAVLISIGSQGLRGLYDELRPLNIKNSTFILCMKGIEIETGKRLSEVTRECTDPSNKVAVWIGPGHVQEFYAGIPNCMVIDSEDKATKKLLVESFSSDLIRFYYGEDIIGNEIGAAAKNVIGIAAGMLDGVGMSTLKGPLMSRGTREVARLIEALGGKGISAYGLCHLGDYEATVFSQYSHNRKFGETYVKGIAYNLLAEGYYTADAIHRLAEKYEVDMPICEAVYNILYNKVDHMEALNDLFSRSLKKELH